jgi:hypothetical protein
MTLRHGRKWMTIKRDKDFVVISAFTNDAMKHQWKAGLGI